MLRGASLHALRRRLADAARALPVPWDRAAARRRSKARLADELLATLDPLTLFDAGYAADRLVRRTRRRITTVRIRQHP